MFPLLEREGFKLRFPPLQGEGQGGDGLDCNRPNKQKDTHPPPGLPLEGGGVKKGLPLEGEGVKKGLPLEGEGVKNLIEGDQEDASPIKGEGVT